MTRQNLTGEIEVYEVGARRLYVKVGVRSIAISEDDLTPEELIGIASDIAARQAILSQAEIKMDGGDLDFGTPSRSDRWRTGAAMSSGETCPSGNSHLREAGLEPGTLSPT